MIENKDGNRTTETDKSERAFWPYDAWPYLLSGIITHESTFAGYPSVFIAGYGAGSHFRDVFRFPLKKGDELNAKLNDLKSARRASLEAIENAFDKKLSKLLGEYGGTIKAGTTIITFPKAKNKKPSEPCVVKPMKKLVPVALK